MNGTDDSPAIALAKSVLPVPGAPVNKAPRGILAPVPKYFSGSLRKSTISSSSSLALSIPWTSSNRVEILLSTSISFIILSLFKIISSQLISYVSSEVSLD